LEGARQNLQVVFGYKAFLIKTLYLENNINPTVFLLHILFRMGEKGEFYVVRFFMFFKRAHELKKFEKHCIRRIKKKL
jgi:hypothetical protein